MLKLYEEAKKIYEESRGDNKCEIIVTQVPSEETSKGWRVKEILPPTIYKLWNFPTATITRGEIKFCKTCEVTAECLIDENNIEFCENCRENF